MPRIFLAPKITYSVRMDQSASTSLHLSESSVRTRMATDSASPGGMRNMDGIDIRIYLDGLLMACCKAQSIAPARFFARINPLLFPVNTRIEIEFVSGESSNGIRLAASVIERDSNGVKLSLDRGLASPVHSRDNAR